VLVGHGSTANRNSSAPVYQHAGELRRRRLFAEVRECFWKEKPFIREVLRDRLAPRVFIVPIFVSEGYFTEEIIPREFGLRSAGQDEFDRVQRRGSQTVFYSRPVGSHPSMTNVLLARARDVITKHPFPIMPRPCETALFIAGHGTGRNENSRKAIAQQVALIGALNEYAEVHPVFMEEEPRIADCYRLARARNLVVVPFFISDGLHTQEDIPVLLGETESAVRARLEQGQPPWRNPTEKHGKHVWYAPAIGSEPHLADVILERVEEMVN
jgi:sirohydrochlorin cobaltochelatase